MRVLSAFISASLLLTSLNFGAATPVVDLSLAERSVSASPVVSLKPIGPKITHYYATNGSQLATIKSTDVITSVELAALQSLVNDQVITYAFETTAKVTEIVCRTAGPTACLVTGLVVVFGIFFSIWQLSGRELSDNVFNLDYPPVAGCGSRCRLELEAPEGDWRVVGNATVNGVFHAIHYRKNGTYHGLRSIQYSSEESFVKRAEDDDGGVVVDYNWESLSETAYDSFDSNSGLINEFANDVAGDMENANSLVTCADFADSDGYLDGGLVSVGWNDQPYNFDEPGELESIIDACESK